QGVRHGVAADRLALAVDHQELARASLRLVEGGRVAEVECEMRGGGGLHLPAADRVEPPGGLPVALLGLRPEIARPGADRVGLEMVEAAVVALPPALQLRLLL